MKNELNLQKSLYSDQKSKISDKTLIDIAKELEQKLLNKENEVLKMKENEINLKKQLYSIKKTKNSFDLNRKPSNSITFSQSRLSRLCSISVAPHNKENQLYIIKETEVDTNERPVQKPYYRTASSVASKEPYKNIKNNEIHENPEIFEVFTITSKYGEIYINCIFYKVYIRKLKEENKILQDSLSSIRDAAIEAVMDKEKEICENKAQFEELESFYKEQIDISLNTIQILEAKLAKFSTNTEDTNRSELFMDKIQQLEVYIYN